MRAGGMQDRVRGCSSIRVDPRRCAGTTIALLAGMHRALATATVALFVSACEQPVSSPCSFALFEGSWSGSASYTATTPGKPDGASGASEVSGEAGGPSCDAPTAFVVLGGCRLDGVVTAPRSMVLHESASPCTLTLANETLAIRVTQGNALIAANDTLELSLGGELLARDGQALQNATVTLDFEGRQ